MKRLFTFFFLLTSIALFAQPANDDCPGIVNLGIAPSCDSTLYNNVGATESNIGFDNFPGCWVNNPERDVWFSFVASDTILDYRISVTGCPDPDNGFDAMLNPQVAIYRGDCEFDGLQLLECGTSANGDGLVELDLVGLTPGITYFIRINDWSSSATPNEGAFKLCVIKKPPITTIDQGGSVLCSGTLYDSGGPDEDYGNDENYVFTICPTNPHNCINFSLEYYNVETFAGDAINFYDGPDTNSPLVGSVDGTGSGDFANTGGVCYSVSASSGCLTVEFISDGAIAFEGFAGYWECTTDECQQNQPITVNTDATPQEIVESVVAGQTTISVVDIDCPNGALGTFESGPNSDLGLDKGLLLTSGSAANVANPATFFSSEGNGALGDADLDSLSFNYSTIPSASNDACIVELEVFAATEEITFEYIFGSEEYPGFVQSSFNDIFAFLASGPGIVGDPVIGGQLNVATLPNGSFIEVNTVNDGLNWQYYRDNTEGQSVVYGGLTSDSLGIKKSLTASIPTIPCNTYTLKFKIADRADSAYDSGVFVGEIKGGSPNLGVNYLSGIDYLVEGCTPISDEVTISLNNQDFNNLPVTYNIEVGGTADLGLDYTLDIPSTVTFETGDEVFVFPIFPTNDGLVEGTETVEISLTQDFGCGETVLTTTVINIFDNLNVDILDDVNDTVLVCGGSCVQLNAFGAGEYFWEPPGVFSDPEASNPTVCPDSSFWVYVTGTLGICTDNDSVYLEVITPEIEVLPGPTATICTGDSITLEAVNNVNNSNLQWQSFFVGFDDPNDPVQTIVPPPFFNTLFLTVSVELGGCIASEDVTITVDPFDFPQLAEDTTICQNFSVDLGEDIIFTTTSFEWTPDIDLDPGNNVSGPVATPDVTTTYQLVATSVSGVCQDTSEVTVTVIPADIEIQNPDTTYICIGDTVTLNSVNTTAGVGVSWTPQDFLTEISPEEVQVYPPITTWYYNILDATAECTVIDSVLIWVDSIPDLSIMAVPDKETYCQGEEITLVSPTYEPANFPDIDFTWLDPMPGSQTPDSFLNLVILATETNTFIRETTVNACSSTDSIQIEVVPVASMTVEPAIDTICQGESVDLTVIAPPEVTDFTWTPATGLTCDDCPNPTASPPVTTNYSVEGEFMGCPVGAAATVVVTPGPQFDFPDPPFVCPGDQIQLNLFDDPNATYSWTSSDGSLTSSDSQPIVNPTQTTTYFLTASRGDCLVEAQVTIEVPSDFTLTIDPVAALCPGESATLQANADAPNISFVWTDENNNSVGNGASISVTPPVTTTYTVSASDPAGCFTNLEVITVEVSPAFTVEATADPAGPVIAGTEVTLNATATVGGITFIWQDNFGEVIGTDANISVSSCETEVYTLIGTDAIGCEEQDQVIVEVSEGFSIDSTFLIQFDTIPQVFEGEEIQIGVSTTPSVINGANFDWLLLGEVITSTNDTLSGPLNAPEVEMDQIFTYGVLITDAVGCTAFDTTDVIVLNNPVEVPNVFTPNGDGKNDLFLPTSRVPVTITSFQVWNRWGELVYNNENVQAGWDGNYEGEPAISDVYIYRIVWEITGGSGTQVVEKGDVTLLR